MWRLAMALSLIAATAVAAQEEGRTVILQPVVDEFHRTVTPLGDLNPYRTDLLMRLVALRAAGLTAVDYSDLVMLSGHGTAFAYAPQSCWIIYLPLDDPGATADRLARGTGLAWESLPKAETAEAAWDAVRTAVDVGVPLQASYMDDYLFVGYREADQPEQRQVYSLGGWREPGWMSWQEFGEWVQAFGEMRKPAGRVERTPQRDMAVEVLRRTLVWATKDGRSDEEWIPPAAYGVPGMEAYAADLADTAKAPDYWTQDWLGCHAINRQSSGRECASDYLERVAVLFPSEAASHLRAAALHYRAAHNHWREFDRQLGRLRPEAAGGPLPVWSDPACRAAGAAAVRKAAHHERQAVREIDLALQALAG